MNRQVSPPTNLTQLIEIIIRVSLKTVNKKDAIKYVIDLLEANKHDNYNYVNAKDSYGQTALFYAEDSGTEAELIKILLKYGADVNIKDKFNHDAIYLCRNLNKVKIIEKLQQLKR
jgi:ankyrin repeat protein